jgi:N-acetylglucosamine-6-phosphate deacetylase
MTYALTQAKLFTGKQLLDDHAIVVKGDRIHSIIPMAELEPTLETHAMNGALICAGFIDLQLNGCGGVMLNGNVTPDTLAHMHQTNLRSATTSFLPTLITCDPAEMHWAVATLREHQQLGHRETLGLHLEGPHLSAAKKGIHQAEYIRPMSHGDLTFYLDNSDIITQITLAPESVTPAQIRELSASGIMVAIGHTNASYETCQKALASGARFGTHLFNAMSAFESRSPGCVGALLDSTSSYAGIIADGMHVDYACVRIAKRLMGERLCLVTDGTAASGSAIDEFEFVGRTIQVIEGRCQGEDGTLGGSSLTLIQGIRNLVSHVGLNLEEALRMATLYPATVLGKADEIGQLIPGSRADMAILDDQLQVMGHVYQGQLGL